MSGPSESGPYGARAPVVQRILWRDGQSPIRTPPRVYMKRIEWERPNASNNDPGVDDCYGKLRVRQRCGVGSGGCLVGLAVFSNPVGPVERSLGSSILARNGKHE